MTVGVVKARVALDVATAVMLALGIYFWFREPVVQGVTLPGVSAAAVAGGRPAVNVGVTPDAGPIATSNMFSASRAAPASRYTPPGAGGASADASGAPMQEPAAVPVSPPTVYGTMTGPNGASALIQSDSAGASSRLYREGDRVGPFRIEKILASSVVVRGPTGRLELKVEQREKPE